MRDEADVGRGSQNRATTESSEDYLEAILRIRSERGSCRNVDIAERLGVSKASVTKALGNLARGGLAEVVGRDVRLTEEGGRLAEATLAKHRFFERLLAESGVDAKTEFTPISLTPSTPPKRPPAHASPRTPRG